MKTTEEICNTVRNQDALFHTLPSGYSRSVPIPGIVNGTPALTFHFYLAEGPLGQPKRIHAPFARVKVDKRTSKLMEMTFAPAVWLPGHDHDTLLGYFPPRALVGLSVKAVEEQYRDYYQLTDRLLDQATEVGDLAAAPLWIEWKAAFQRVHEESLAAYFRASGLDPEAFNGQSPGSADISTTGHPSAKSLPSRKEKSADDASPLGTHPETPAQSVVPGFAAAAVDEGKSDQIRRCTEALLVMMDRARALLRSAEYAALQEQWQRISRMFDPPVFMVAVVGEFSSGKSSLINRLLGESVLTEGDLPTTAMLTRVMAGDAAMLTHILPDRSRREIPLTRDNVEQFSANSDGHGPAGVLELKLPHAWLQQNSVAFIDTPGAGDLVKERVALACEAIANCEAALIAVSALKPLSGTEKNFIEEHLFSRKVPRMAIVLTRLDQVAEKDRERLVQYVVDKVQTLKYPIEVWSAQGEPVLKTDLPLPAKGTQQILNVLERWARAPDRVSQRLVQIASQLLDLLAMQRAATVARLQVLQADEAVGKVALAKAKQLLDNEQMTWEDLRLEVERRSNAAQDWLLKSVSEVLPNLHKRLRNELNRTSNPKEWWHKELPSRVNEDLRGRAQAWGATLAERFKVDAAWLAKAVQQTFSVQLGNQALGPVIELGEDPLLPPREGLVDLDRFRTQWRIASFVTTGAVCYFFGPFGGLIPGLTAFAAERSISEKIDEQRTVLSDSLEANLHAVLQAAQATGRNNIDQGYRRLLNETKEREATWQKSRLSAICAVAPQSEMERAKTSETLGQLDALMREICLICTELEQ